MLNENSKRFEHVLGIIVRSACGDKGYYIPEDTLIACVWA
jgi:hypothetical protein